MPVQGVYRPPANVDDMGPTARKAWSKKVDSFFTSSASSDGRPRKQFFCALERPVADGAWAFQSISWSAFPKIVESQYPGDRVAALKAADADRTVQDEYCEWAVTRDGAGRITRVDMTSESPEYFEALSRAQPATLLALYQQHVSPDVRKEDLYDGRAYNPQNKWNNSTEGGRVMHLIQRNNTLGAEIELAASATVVRVRGDGSDITDEQVRACVRVCVCVDMSGVGGG